MSDILSFVKEAFSNLKPNYALTYPYGIAIVGSHFGDCGKGKFVDFIIRILQKAGKRVINVRAQGGGNAGHTVVDELTKEEYHFHYLPSGGLVSDLILLGAGMLLDPLKILEEVDKLPDNQQAKILIDGRATFCTYLERLMDGIHEEQKAKKGKAKIGTTGSGVGPAVSYRALRTHITFFDAQACKNADELLEKFYAIPGVPESVWKDIATEYGSVEAYVQKLYDAVQELNIVDSMPIIQKTKDEGWALVLEVSQAFCLDSVFGNCGKFVTSTHTTVAGALADAGLVPEDLTEGALLIAKGYASKVGSGPFMTKFGQLINGIHEKWIAMENLIAQFIYNSNGERGVTTKRLRDLGWFDCVAVRAAIQRNGSRKLAVNCMDTLGCIPGNTAKICISYRNKSTGGKTVFWPYFQNNFEPVYKEIPVDWDIKHFTSADETKLPDGVWEYLGNIAYYTGADICFIGTGGSAADVVEITDYGKTKIAAVMERLKQEDAA